MPRRSRQEPARRRLRLAGTTLVACLASLTLAAQALAIVGGEPAPPGRWPWMAGLLEAKTHSVAQAQFCGGVVISPRRVLTAGHCVIDETSRSIDVLVGRTRLTEAGGRRIPVQSISVYPGLVSRRTPGLDAAVITLKSDAGVPPLALARPGQDAAWAPGTSAWTIGWGAINGTDSPGGNRYYADRLRELQVPVQGDDACESAYGIGVSDLPYRRAWLLCAGAADGIASACFGDSGGPLVVGGPEAWLDVGIVLGSDACASPGYYDLFARVDAISGFALGAKLTRQPDPVARPRITGRLAAGAEVHCTPGRWRGSRARFTYRWTRTGDRRQHVLGRLASYRLTARDARAGVSCAVTGSNRGGRNTATARPLRRH
jgi:secreted trypsin-like serine protease